ncbi:alpha/beta hydrolase [Actinomadura rubrisoli]|uniref:Alpha/beta hydrolase n=1 Tax=Actinomadura rubrisoli TaxID=2530368 RepID=A0A4V2YYR5_9ACTN|nr:alpha/beta hydrolase [Actinomadura rubrisoli]TDD94237.1 alpha/beta hydrolase [Actinomadura rubrisoli]
MNDVAELKRYAIVHARGLEISGYGRLLDRITEDGAGPGSWAGEWSAEGDRLAAAGRDLEASRHYLMARFPFVDGPARQAAYDKSLETFQRWSAGKGITKEHIEVDGTRLGIWQTGLSAAKPRPLLLVTGGFITLKEQWAPALPIFARLGMAAVALEMPGVGENPLAYDGDSWRFLSGVIDAIGGRADASRTYALAMSFAGHQALRCAMDDPRIRGVLTVGAPVTDFFTDQVWQKDLPRITVDTLAHLSGTDLDGLRSWALPAGRLAGLDVPVAYVASRRDEIIPPADPLRLREHVRDLRLLEHDDVHGSPAHVEETKLWLGLELLRMRGARGPMPALLNLMLAVERTKARLLRARRAK